MCTDILDMTSEQINNEKIIFHSFSRSLFFYPSKAGHSFRSAHLSYHSIQTTFVPEGLTIKPQTHYIPRSTSSPQQEKNIHVRPTSSKTTANSNPQSLALLMECFHYRAPPLVRAARLRYLLHHLTVSAHSGTVTRHVSIWDQYLLGTIHNWTRRVTGQGDGEKDNTTTTTSPAITSNSFLEPIFESVSTTLANVHRFFPSLPPSLPFPSP